MTSKKSSVNPFIFTIKSTIQKYWFLPTALMVYMTALLSSTGFLAEKKYLKNLADPTYPGYTKTAVEDYLATNRYFLTELGSDVYVLLIQSMIVIASVLLAVFVFGFIASKKSVNVYYSLGISRNGMFTAKYIAGASMLSIAVTVPYLAAFLGNVWIFGFSKELLLACVYFAASSIAVSLLCFGVTTAVLNCVGSIVEGIAYSAVILIAPFALSKCISALFNVFVFGSSFGEYFYVVNPAAYNEAVRFSPMDYLGFSNPLTFNCSADMNALQSLSRESAEDAYAWTSPDWSEMFLWLAVTAALFVIGLLIYKRRKAEKAGFLGVSKPLTAFSVFLVGMCIFGYMFSNYSIYYSKKEIGNKLLVMLAGIAIMALVYAASEIVLFRSFKGIFKSAYKLGIEAGVFVVVCLLFIGGFFGYANRVPEIAEVESVAVSTGTSNSLLVPFTNSSSNNEGWYDEFSGATAQDIYSGKILLSNSSNVVNCFDDGQSIGRIVEIHQSIINANSFSDSAAADRRNELSRNGVGIIYHLKNGKTLARYYNNTSVDTLDRLSELQATQDYRDAAVAVFNEWGEEGYCEYRDEGKYVGFASSTLDNLTFLDEYTVGEKRAQLVDAIRADVEAGNMPLNLSSKEQPLGFVVFSLDKELSSPGAYGIEYSYSELGVEYSSEQIITTSSDGAFFSINDYTSTSIPIYPSMTNLLSFIKSNDLGKYLENVKTIKKVRLFKDVDENSIFKPGSNNTIEIAGRVESPELSGKLEDSAAAYIVTDIKTISELVNVIVLYGKYVENGCYCELCFEDGSTTIGFIPNSALDTIALG